MTSWQWLVVVLLINYKLKMMTSTTDQLPAENHDYQLKEITGITDQSPAENHDYWSVTSWKSRLVLLISYQLEIMYYWSITSWKSWLLINYQLEIMTGTTDQLPAGNHDYWSITSWKSWLLISYQLEILTDQLDIMNHISLCVVFLVAQICGPVVWRI